MDLTFLYRPLLVHFSLKSQWHKHRWVFSFKACTVSRPGLVWAHHRHKCRQLHPHPNQSSQVEPPPSSAADRWWSALQQRQALDGSVTSDDVHTWQHLPSARICHLLEVLTGGFACPLDLPVDEHEVEDEPAEDEDDTVQVLHGRLVDDGSNN